MYIIYREIYLLIFCRNSPKTTVTFILYFHSVRLHSFSSEVARLRSLVAYRNMLSLFLMPLLHLPCRTSIVHSFHPPSFLYCNTTLIFFELLLISTLHSILITLGVTLHLNYFQIAI